MLGYITALSSVGLARKSGLPGIAGSLLQFQKKTVGNVIVMDRPSVHLVIPFSTPREAEIAYNSLRVDKEPKRGQVEKKLSVDGKNLIVDLEGADVKSLRSSTNSFFEYLLLVQKTIEKFSIKESKECNKA